MGKVLQAAPKEESPSSRPAKKRKNSATAVAWGRMGVERKKFD